MSPELDELLCHRYSSIFVNRHSDMSDTAMCWGFECGEGWFTVLDSLCNQIQSYIDWKNKRGQVVPQVVATQVKEKFGGLRFYYDGGDEVVNGMVRMAESWAACTCEQCGKPGRLRGRNWLYTACDEHTKQEHLKVKEENA